MAQSNKAVFLDRDGVINSVVIRNGLPSVAYNLDEFKVFDYVPEAIRLLKNKGFFCAVVTNQPDLGRGNLLESALEEIHDFMKSKIGIDAVYFCPHDKDGECDCKKPAIGMVMRAVTDHGIDLKKSWVIGDRWRDIELGKTVGCKTILISSPATDFDKRQVNADFIAKNLLEAARLIQN